MKYLYITVFLLSTFNVMAQTDSSQTEYYLQIKASPKGIGRGPYKLSIDFGEKYLSMDSLEREQIKSKIRSYTEIGDVLPYLNSQGWTLLTAFATSHEHFHTFYYVMKREK